VISYLERRPALARGWHRDFCIGPDTRYAGNPSNPGYMLGLDRVGQCRGVSYRLDRKDLAESLEPLLETEPRSSRDGSQSRPIVVACQLSPSELTASFGLTAAISRMSLWQNRLPEL
jgi:cation transport regulator ChaC